MSVIDESGSKITLFSLWEKRKLVLIFTRHMGCRFCKEQVSELKKIQPKLMKHGLTVGIITVGKYEDIPKFKQENLFTGEVYVDSSLFSPDCYKTMKLGNGMKYLFAMDDSKPANSNDGNAQDFLPETKEAAERAVEKGFTDGGYGTPDSEFTGDTLQIGGAFVLGPGNSCDYSYRCSFVGDLVDLDKVVAAATGRDAEGEEIFYSRTLDWNEKLNIHAFAEAVPKGPVRKLVANMQENSNVNDLLQYSTIGAGVFVVFIALVLKIRTCVQIAEEKLEYVLVTAAGVISMAVLLAYALNLKVYFLSTKISETQNSGLSDLSNSAKNGSACPVKLTQVIGSTTQNIGGCTLYKLSAVDKIALHSAGDVHCDCTFLEEVDMINMTDRYTLSAPVAVNAGLFSHGSRHPEHVRSPSLGSHPTRSSSSNRDSESESESKRGSEEELRVSSEQPTAATSNSLPDNSSQHAPSMAKQEQNQHNKQGQQQAELQLEVDPQQRLSGDHLLAAQSTLCYVREFLAKPNPNLGRKGPTCPFVPKSLQLDSIYLAVLPAESLSSSGNDVGSDISGCSDVLDCILLQAIQTFKALEPRTGPKASYKAIILIFPDMEPSDIPAMIDGTQKRLKPNFVEEGLMLGEFHLRNNATGLHNPHFYPLRTPYPCLAIRHMVPSDIVFLNPTEFPADVRVKMISTFLAKFGDKASNDQQTEVARALLKELSA